MTKYKINTQNKHDLEKLLSMGQGSLEYMNLRSEIKQHLTDPGILEKSDITNDNLKEEARIILDAFEAITNGMHNPEVFSKVEAISEDSILDLWKELIYAIRAFYKRDYVKMGNSLGKIDSDSPLILFKSILLHLSGMNQLKVSNKKQKAFIDNIIKDRSFIRSVISQIIESLEYDMEGLFIETSILLLHDLNKSYKETACKFAIWSIETASRYKYAPTDLIVTCKKLFGNTAAYRYTAIAMKREEPDISLLFWIQSLLSGLKSKNLKIHEAGAYLTLISRIAWEIRNSTDEFYLESLRSLVITLRSELDNEFPDLPVSVTQASNIISNPFEYLVYLSSVYSSLEENRVRLESITIKTRKRTSTGTGTNIIKSKKDNSKPIQLSLF